MCLTNNSPIENGEKQTSRLDNYWLNISISTTCIYTNNFLLRALTLAISLVSNIEIQIRENLQRMNENDHSKTIVQQASWKGYKKMIPSIRFVDPYDSQHQWETATVFLVNYPNDLFRLSRLDIHGSFPLALSLPVYIQSSFQQISLPAIDQIN